MELEEIQPTHSAKRCPRCGETTLRGSVRWSEDSRCRSCGHDFAGKEAKEAGKPTSEESAPNQGSFDLELEEGS